MANALTTITKWTNGKNTAYQGVVKRDWYRLAASISLRTSAAMTTRTNRVNLGCLSKNEELSKASREMKILRFNGGLPR